MPATPEIVTRDNQPYVAIRARLPQNELASLGPAWARCSPGWEPAVRRRRGRRFSSTT